MDLELKTMKIKIKKLSPDAVIPSYSKDGDAGLDLVATEITCDNKYNNTIYKTGLAIEIPKGYVGLIFPRSSIYKTVLSLTNSVCVIDSGYRGEIMLRFVDNFSPEENPLNRFKKFTRDFYQVGDRVGQLIIMPYPQIEFEEVEELSKTERGEGGFGSTGI